MRLALRLILCFFLAFSTASTVFAAPSIRDQAIEISKELRDPGAVNQSLYESNAPQAAELKAKIYQLLENGESREMCWSILLLATESKFDTILLWIHGPLRFGLFPPYFLPVWC